MSGDSTDSGDHRRTDADPATGSWLAQECAPDRVPCRAPERALRRRLGVRILTTHTKDGKRHWRSPRSRQRGPRRRPSHCDLQFAAFPRTGALEPWLIEAQHPDDFLVDMYRQHPEVLVHVLHEQAQAIRKDLPWLLAVQRQGMPRFAGLVADGLTVDRWAPNSVSLRTADEARHIVAAG